MSTSKPVNRNMSGKVALITGSSSGIGAQIAILLASYGAQVVINGLEESEVAEIAQQADFRSRMFYHRTNKRAGSLGTLDSGVNKSLRALPMAGDVTDSTFVRLMIDEIISRFQRLDILINSAGAGCLGLVEEPTILEHYDRIMKLNVRTVVELTNLAIPHLEKSNGNIVNISTILAQKPSINNSMYCVSKSALDMFTKCCALELAPKNIRVNSVNPGPVRTGFLSALGATSEKVKELYDALREKEPIGRIGETMDVASAVAFLVSDEATFITGATLTIDGAISLV